MSRLNELYDALPLEARNQVDQIMSSRKPLEVKPPEGPLERKIENIDEIDFSLYPTGKDLQAHLRRSGYSEVSQEMRSAIRGYFDSETGKASIKNRYSVDNYY